MNEWNDELRTLLYEGELDVAARSNLVTTIDAIVGANALEKDEMNKQIADLNSKLANTQIAMTNLVLENSKHVAASAAVVPTVETPDNDEAVEGKTAEVETVEEAVEEIGDALDELAES